MTHPLSRWLFDQEERAVKFADRIGVSQSYLSEVLAYKKMPSFDFMEKVKKGTKGAIMPNDFQRPAAAKREKGTKAHV